MDPMQSRFEPEDPGRTMVMAEWMLSDPFRSCKQPEISNELWPGGFSPLYCAVYWGGISLVEPIYLPFMIIFGNNKFTLRILAASLTTLTAYIYGRMAQSAWGPEWGYLLATIYLLIPLMAFYGWHYQQFLTLMILLPIWVMQVTRGLEGKSWKGAYLVLILASIDSPFFSIAVMLIASTLVLISSKGRWEPRWKHAVAFVLIAIAVNLSDLFVTHIAYGGRRSTLQSASLRRTTWSLVSSELFWSQTFLHFSQFGWMLPLGIGGGIVAIVFSRKRTSLFDIEFLTQPKGRLLLTISASGSIGIMTMIFFAQAVTGASYFLIPFVSVFAVATVWLLHCIRNKSIQAGLIFLVLLAGVLSVDSTYEREGNLRKFTPVWNTWMEEHITQTDVVMMDYSMTVFDATIIHSMDGAELRIMESNLDQEIMLRHIDEHPEVTVVILPYNGIESKGTLRQGLDERGWERHSVAQYIGGYHTWIFFTSPDRIDTNQH